jgi:uncharacterized protein (TIGR03000 family)
MFRKLFSCGGLLLLAGAITFVTPALGEAQHGSGGHGGGHVGGGHFGAGHLGGAHFGGGHFVGARVGGYHGSFYRGGYHHSYPYYGHYGYHGYYPYYGLYSYYPYFYDAYPYDLSGATYDSGYSGSSVASDSYPYDNPSLQPDLRDAGSYGASTPAYPYGYSSVAAQDMAPVQADTVAHITARVPANAELWFDGSKTTTTGSVREFQSPPLTPGSRYVYEVRARWKENGHEVTQTQKVEVTAGADVHLNFPVSGIAAG